MASKIINFIKYNNAFTLAFMLLFLSTGTIFAANDDLRQSVISKENRIVAIDNTYIRTVDLATFDPAIQIKDVTEDVQNYYVTYSMHTIEVIDGVWARVANEEMLTVAKDQLGESDLGLYVAQEIQEVRDRQLAYLKEVQVIEQRIGETPRVVQTDYDGLIGRMFDPTQSTFIGYEPVIPEEKSPEENVSTDIVHTIESLAQPNALAASIEAAQQAKTTQQITTSEQSPKDTNYPIITLLGSATLEVPQNTPYVEPGATATDLEDGDLTSAIIVDGVINTEVLGTYELTYTAKDEARNATTVVRKIIVTPPTAGPDETPPVITLSGASDIRLQIGEKYTELGATAHDDVDGDISDLISISSNLDTTTAGEYEVSYTVSDSAGNISSSARIVIVTDPSEPELAAQEVVE